jgi:hypothetical protein
MVKVVGFEPLALHNLKLTLSKDFHVEKKRINKL